MKTTLAVYLIFYKLIFFETSIIFHNHIWSCNQINYMDIWFAKVRTNLIMMAQVLFFGIFSKKDLHLNAVEFLLFFHLGLWNFHAGWLTLLPPEGCRNISVGKIFTRLLLSLLEIVEHGSNLPIHITVFPGFWECFYWREPLNRKG